MPSFYFDSIKISEILDNLEKDVIKIRNKTESTAARKIAFIARDIVPVFTGTLKRSIKVVGASGGELGAKTSATKGVSVIADATVGEQYEALSDDLKAKYPVGSYPNEKYAAIIPAKDMKSMSFSGLSIDGNFLETAVEIFSQSNPKFEGTILGEPISIPYDIPFRGMPITRKATKKSFKKSSKGIAERKRIRREQEKEQRKYGQYTQKGK